jgi:hypothetical protein
VLRSSGADGAGEWVVDLQRIMDQRQPDVRLERNDSVIVPYATARKAVYGVYQFVTAIVRITVGGALTVF